MWTRNMTQSLMALKKLKVGNVERVSKMRYIYK